MRRRNDAARGRALALTARGWGWCYQRFPQRAPRKPQSRRCRRQRCTSAQPPSKKNPLAVTMSPPWHIDRMNGLTRTSSPLVAPPVTCASNTDLQLGFLRARVRIRCSRRAASPLTMFVLVARGRPSAAPCDCWAEASVGLLGVAFWSAALEKNRKRRRLRGSSLPSLLRYRRRPRFRGLPPAFALGAGGEPVDARFHDLPLPRYLVVGASRSFILRRFHFTRCSFNWVAKPATPFFSTNNNNKRSLQIAQSEQKF